MSKLQHTVVNWALSFAAVFAVLFLNAYLERQHSETETQFLIELSVVDAIAAQEADHDR